MVLPIDQQRFALQTLHTKKLIQRSSVVLTPSTNRYIYLFVDMKIGALLFYRLDLDPCNKMLCDGQERYEKAFRK